MIVGQRSLNNRLWHLMRVMLIGVWSSRPASGRKSAFLSRSLVEPSSRVTVSSFKPSIQDTTRRMIPPTIETLAYEPSPMDPNILLSQIAVIGVSGAAAAVWWYVLVPSERTNLARSKRTGPLNDYLEDLREEDARSNSSLFTGQKKVERWLLSDWLSPDTTRKAAALPFLPKAKFNSGDNPILAAGALILMTGVVFSLLGLT